MKLELFFSLLMVSTCLAIEEPITTDTTHPRSTLAPLSGIQGFSKDIRVYVRQNGKPYALTTNSIVTLYYATNLTSLYVGTATSSSVDTNTSSVLIRTTALQPGDFRYALALIESGRTNDLGTGLLTVPASSFGGGFSPLPGQIIDWSTLTWIGSNQPARQSNSNYFSVVQSPVFVGSGTLSYLYSSDYESSIRLSRAGLLHGIGIYFTAGGASGGNADLVPSFTFADPSGTDLEICPFRINSYKSISLSDNELTNCAAVTFSDGTRLTTATASYSAPSNLAYSATITPDASEGLFRKITLAGNLTINVPTNGTEGMVWTIYITCDESARTLALNASILIPTDSSFVSPKTLTASKLYILQLRRFGSAWGLSSLVGGF